MGSLLSLKKITKKFGDAAILNDIDSDTESGHFYTLLGSSGCGKTTILKLIAGFEQSNEGRIIYKNQSIEKLPANKRRVDTVFQDCALFPHLNVYKNVTFGLRLKKFSKQEIDKEVKKALKLAKLTGYEQHHIDEVSGGQRQRVATARAIINKPEILLLDESLLALDLKLRAEMQYELRELQKRLDIVFILVTHGREEALTLSDYIFVMRNGEIQQFGTPTDIYDGPVNRFVADSVGESNIVDDTMVRDFVVNIYGQGFECVDARTPSREEVGVVIRLEDISLVESTQGLFAATVDSMLFRSVYCEICYVDEKGYEWVIQSTKKTAIGSQIGLFFEPEVIHTMVPEETEEESDKRVGSYEDIEHA